MESSNNNNNPKKLPESFYCPLTTELMKDPVVDPEGNTYDREAITAWLQKNSTSPITRNPLKVEDLIPNRALKETMDMFHKGEIDASDIQISPPKGIEGRQQQQSDKKEHAKPQQDSDIKIEVVSKSGHAMISLIPPAKKKNVTRTPATVCCVIDVSGSMADEAKIQDEAGKSEGFGLSILDLVKHAVRTIISSLSDQDQLALVSFTDQAAVVLGLTKMTDAGKKKAEKALEALQPLNSTNIWDGLYQGLEVLRQGAPDKNSAVFLLTDGQPNVIPPRGHLPMLQKYKDEHGLPGIVNTFGFGYNLDSKLLNELSVAGNGAYAFIPDGSFVGTIFVNALSNLMSTAACNVCLSVEMPNTKFIDFSSIKQYSHQVASWGFDIQLGSVMFGQPKRFVLPVTLDGSTKLSIKMTYESPFEAKHTEISQDIQVELTQDTEIDMQILRLSFVNEVTRALELMATSSNDAMMTLKNLIKEIKESNVAGEKYMKDLLTDVEGQTVMAISQNNHFKKWGRHFLPSLIRAHLLQQCNNFKDPGVQNYGGEIFSKIRDKIDDIFVKLPPPKQSVKKAGPQPVIKSMAKFYNAYGGCIAGDCVVLMADGSMKLIKDLTKGDQIMGSNGQAVKITCVVKTVCKDNKAQLVKFDNGLKITAWHPIRLNGKFFFPCTAEEEMPFEYKFFECEAVYNFVIESDHLMTVNGVECVTLGHGFQEDVVRHEYYGTSAIIDDLKRMEGWENGLVMLGSGDMKRDEKSGMVVGMIKGAASQVESNNSVVLV